MKLFYFTLIALVFSAFGASAQNSTTFESVNKLYDDGRYAEALNVVEDIIEQSGPSYESLLLKGNCLQKEEKFVAAIQAYEEAEKLNGNSAILLANLGAAYFNLSQTEEAEKKIKKALKIDPELPEGHYYMGNVKYQEFSLSMALKYYNKAIELKPDYREALYMRAASYAEMEDYTAAIRDYEEVLKIDPNLATAKFNIAVIRLVNEEYEKAAEDFAQLSPKDVPREADYYFYSGEALYFAGKKDEACSYYERAVELGDAESANIYKKYCENKEEREADPEKRTIRMAF